MIGFEELFSILPKPPQLWSILDVGIWLAFLRLKPLASPFATCGVDGSCIESIETDDLENELGVTSLTTKKRLMKWFKQTLKEYEHFVNQKNPSVPKLKRVLTQKVNSPDLQPCNSFQLIVRPFEDTQQIATQFYKLKDQEMSIGRNINSHMIVREETVSGNHARIFKEDNKFYLEDNGSKNGTYIRTRERQFLEVGHLIEMGSYLFEVVNTGQKQMDLVYSGPDVVGTNLTVKLDESKQSFDIGRNPQNDLFFNDSHMSGRHAKFYLLSGRFVVEDLDSTNGTWRRISKPNQSSSSQRLNNKTIFKIGNTCSYICNLGSCQPQSGPKAASKNCLACGQTKGRNGLALPCRHLAGCYECLVPMSSCLLCGALIQNLVRVYS